jgi:lipopolysaccharide/colanic/teichoic acid biosynthesis glycosyltransferase
VAGILITGPLFLLVALAIKLDSTGPVFFVQRRCGLRGRTFPFIKFRTMYTDAEERLEELRSYNEVSGPVFKMKNDPRVTRVGRVLRKYSIDELPQLWHVLVGQMSLVGPRPPIPGEVGQYELNVRRRLSVRPGLTCLWQVRGRSLLSFEDWIRLDLEYIDRWSLMLDFRILLLTIPAVLRGKGAS